MSDDIRYERDGHIARVTIDRPQVRNALDERAQRELADIWTSIERDGHVRAVVLSGAGEKAFCAGADMSDQSDGGTGLDYWARANPEGFGSLALRETLDVPVIARVNGYALGGGLEMVLGCDIIVAAEHARFGLPEPRVGRIPLDGGVVRLARQIPYHLAMGMLLTGRQVSASEAHAMGLVNEVVRTVDLDAAVDRVLEDVLACAPLSLRAIKQTLQRTGHLSPREAQAQRTPALVRALCSKDAVEGVLAFRDKRSPEWRGE